MIVPNGDLLSQHLINWTMGKDKRRLIITVGVAYGTDLSSVKQMLTDLLSANDKILPHPQPMVIANEFNASSIDLELIFWSALWMSLLRHVMRYLAKLTCFFGRIRSLFLLHSMMFTKKADLI